jgi:hypothetical protein
MVVDRMEGIFKILSDGLRLQRICGNAVVARWLAGIVLAMPAVLRRRDLQPADAWVGEGPFRIKLSEYGAEFLVGGPHIMSGIREMYCRDVYLRKGILRVEPGDFVVDLGANMG